METVRKVARNTGVLLLGKIIAEAMAFIVVIFLARYLGAVDFGIYSFAFSYLEFFVIITDLGMSLILVRDISQDKSKAGIYIGNAIILKIALSIAAVILACLVMTFLKHEFNTKLLVYIGSLSLLFSFRSLYTVIFQVDLKMEYSIFVNTVKDVLRFVLFIILIFLKAKLVWFIVTVILIIIPELLLLIYFSRKFLKPEFKIDLGIWKALLKESWPLALVAGLVMIYFRIDQLMLFQMKGAEAVGYYSVATRLPESLVILPSAFMTSLFPLMSQYFKTSKESLIKAYSLSFKYMLMFIIPIAVATTLLAKQIITLIFGANFSPSAPALAILIWSEIFVFYGLIHYQIVISAKQQKLYLIFTLTGAVVNVILNLILIPKYGIEGASIATLISYLLSAGPIIGHILPATREYNLVGCSSMVKPFIASLIMGIVIYYLRSQFVVAMILGFSVYCVVMFFIRGIDQEDIKLIKSFLRKENTNPVNL